MEKNPRHVGGRLKIRLNVRFFCKGGVVKIFLKILDNADKNDVLKMIVFFIPSKDACTNLFEHSEQV